MVNRMWRIGQTLDPARFAEVRRKTIFGCHKWDPQVEDVSTLAPFPILLEWDEWEELSTLAERLALETMAMEAELLERPELQKKLGLPRKVVRELQRENLGAFSNGGVRIMRFDFHLTPDGWRISEVNTDVPGGFNEASGFTRVMAEYFQEAVPAGDPAGALAKAVAERVAGKGPVALVHATAYTDDRQAMVFLSDHLKKEGVETRLVSPDHLSWQDGRPWIKTSWMDGEIGGLVRFFPGEWLTQLHGDAAWWNFFRGSKALICNPGSALLSQSKRLPLVWDLLRTAVPGWKSLLPETRDPREVRWRDNEEWVLKPALGRVGEGVTIPGITGKKEATKAAWCARLFPESWIAQRRFDQIPLQTDRGEFYVCAGVYTVNRKSAGIYGRISPSPIINFKAQDVAVLVNESGRHARAAA